MRTPSQGEGAAGDWSGSAARLTEALGLDELSPYERAVLLQMRGRSAYETDNVVAAISDWRAALDLQALPAADSARLRLYTGQLLMAQGEYAEGVALLEAAVASGEVLSADLGFNLAQGHAHLGAHEIALDYGQRARQIAEGPELRHYQLIGWLLQELERNEEQLEHAETMVELWPAERAHWSVYAGLLARAGRDAEAFEARRVMYVAGMLTESEEIVRLARYYAFFENPYPGAVMLEREINAGRADADTETLDLLASLWRQSREWDRVLSVLRSIATTTGEGRHYADLGEALYQTGAYSEAEQVFLQALRRGDVEGRGQIWALIGAARVELDRESAALDAFREAAAYPETQRVSAGWINYLEARIRNTPEGPAGETGWLERLERERCARLVEIQRSLVPTFDTRYDAAGRRLLELDEICLAFYDETGEPLPVPS
jgi:tetratricopeptide (TPR) repeat protein